MQRLAAIGGLTCAALLAAAPANARPSLDQASLDQISRYDVLGFTDAFAGGIERGKAIGVIDATPEEVFRVATDYDKYKDFMPCVIASTVKEAAEDHALVQLDAKLRWPAGAATVTARYTHEKLPGDIYRIRFYMVAGTLKQYLGALYLEPFAPGRTAVTYELVAEPDTIAPRGAINRGIKRSACNFVHALRQRVSDLHRLGYLHPEPMAPPATPWTARAPLSSPSKPPVTLKADGR